MEVEKKTRQVETIRIDLSRQECFELAEALKEYVNTTSVYKTWINHLRERLSGYGIKEDD